MVVVVLLTVVVEMSIRLHTLEMHVVVCAIYSSRFRHVPPPPFSSSLHDNRDTLIQQSATLTKQSECLAVCLNYEAVIRIIYFVSVIHIWYRTVNSYIAASFSSKSAPPLSKLWIRP